MNNVKLYRKITLAEKNAFENGYILCSGAFIDKEEKVNSFEYIKNENRKHFFVFKEDAKDFELKNGMFIGEYDIPLDLALKYAGCGRYSNQFILLILISQGRLSEDKLDQFKVIPKIEVSIPMHELGYDLIQHKYDNPYCKAMNIYNLRNDEDKSSFREEIHVNTSLVKGDYCNHIESIFNKENISDEYVNYLNEVLNRNNYYKVINSREYDADLVKKYTRKC